MREVRSATVAVLVLATGCTSVDLLYPAVDPPAPPEVQPNMMQGTFCTEDPSTIVFPRRSGS